MLLFSLLLILLSESLNKYHSNHFWRIMNHVILRYASFFPATVKSISWKFKAGTGGDRLQKVGQKQTQQQSWTTKTSQNWSKMEQQLMKKMCRQPSRKTNTKTTANWYVYRLFLSQCARNTIKTNTKEVTNIIRA